MAEGVRIDNCRDDYENRVSRCSGCGTEHCFPLRPGHLRLAAAGGDSGRFFLLVVVLREFQRLLKPFACASGSRTDGELA